MGQASIHAPIKLEPQGFLRNMWNALLYLKSAYPTAIHSVSWFTLEDGFSTSFDTLSHGASMPSSKTQS